MTQSITIKDFKGINMNEGKWQEGYSRYTVGLDVFGLAKNPSKISFPGILQGIFQVSAGTQAASPSAVTELVTGFARFISQDFAIGGANPGRIYRRDAGTWKWVSAITVSAANAGNIIVYGANLYYAQNAVLGQYDNTNGNANFQSFTTSDVNIRPMRVFAGNLYVGNTKQIAKYDGTTFTAAALTLPSDFIMKSMEVFIDRIYISADNGQYSRLFVWDGRSPTFQDYFNMFEEQVAPSLQIVEGKLWVVTNRGASTTGTPIFIFTGSEFSKAFTLPIQRTINSGLGDYGGGLAIASTEGTTATYEDGLAGVWLINHHTADAPYSAILGFPLRNQLTGKTLGAFNFFGQTGYIGAQDVTNSTYEIFEVQGSQANTPNIWESLPIDAGSTDLKMWHSIQINGENLATGQTLIIKYRLDSNTTGSTSWTTLKTFTGTATSNDLSTYIPIGRTSKTIDIRLDLTASSSETVRVRSFTLAWSPASN